MSNPEYRWFTSVRPGISYRPGSEEQVAKGLGEAMDAVQEFSQNNPSFHVAVQSIVAAAAAAAGIKHLTRGEKVDSGPKNHRVLGPEDVPTRDVPYLRPESRKVTIDMRAATAAELMANGRGRRADRKFLRDMNSARENYGTNIDNVREKYATPARFRKKSLRVSTEFLDTSISRLLKNLSYDQNE